MNQKTIRLRILTVIGLLLLPLSGFAGFSDSTLTVVKAEYGRGDRRIDVTKSVESLVSNHSIHLRAPWALGTVDPAFGSVKNVQITYLVGKEKHEATFNQQQDIVLPETR